MSAIFGFRRWASFSGSGLSQEIRSSRTQSLDSGAPRPDLPSSPIHDGPVELDVESSTEDVPMSPVPSSHIWPLNGSCLGLTLVHKPKDTLVDIVFIHGLTGASHRTWTYTGKDLKNFWPGWLPEDPNLSGARIHTFGYLAEVELRSENKVSIREFASKLVHDMQYRTQEPRIGSVSQRSYDRRDTHAYT